MIHPQSSAMSTLSIIHVNSIHYANSIHHSCLLNPRELELGTKRSTSVTSTRSLHSSLPYVSLSKVVNITNHHAFHSCNGIHSTNRPYFAKCIFSCFSNPPSSSGAESNRRFWASLGRPVLQGRIQSWGGLPGYPSSSSSISSPLTKYIFYKHGSW